MFNSFKKAAIVNRVKDAILYECVLDEIEQGIRIKGLWAKALAHSDGSESKAESIYMQYRVQLIKDQFTALQIAYDEMSKNKLFDFIQNRFNEPVAEDTKPKKPKKIKNPEEPKKKIIITEKEREELLKLEALIRYQEEKKDKNKVLNFISNFFSEMLFPIFLILLIIILFYFKYST